MFRSYFPIFTNHPDLVFLDSASSTQKPQQVIDAISNFFSSQYSNIHRWAYDLSMESSLLYEKAKWAIAKKLHATQHEIVFTYNATYAANLISRSILKSGYLKRGDRVLISKVEHHANIVPWQILSEEYGIVIDWIDLHVDGTIDYDSLAEKVINSTVLSITGASNVTGELLDLDRVTHILGGLDKKPIFIVDGSQRFPHIETDVVKYGIDFFFATWHKVMSDTGFGFFYGRKDLIKNMLPAFCGWWAINSVTENGYEPAGLPFRYEPGTPHIAWAVSMLAALDFIDEIGGFDVIEKYEKDLLEYALEQFSTLPLWVRYVGSKKSENRLGVFAFEFDHHHPNDVAEYLADHGVCVRSGHHCTEPFHQAMNIRATLRASFYIYNTRDDIDIFVKHLKDYL